MENGILILIALALAMFGTGMIFVILGVLVVACDPVLRQALVRRHQASDGIDAEFERLDKNTAELNALADKYQEQEVR